MPAPLPSDQELMSRLRRVMHALRHHSMAALEPYDLTPHQARAFLTISRACDDGAPMRLKDLADVLRIAPRSATEVTDALESGELVRREPSPTDRRAMVLRVTDKGAKVAREVRAAQADQPLLATLSETDRRRLGEILGRLSTRAEATEKP